jgi:hypothetical protein
MTFKKELINYWNFNISFFEFMFSCVLSFFITKITLHIYTLENISVFLKSTIFILFLNFIFFMMYYESKAKNETKKK